MWGFGGNYYWARKQTVGKVEGIVVIFAWISSQEKHVKNYIDLYSSLGWNSLVCHSQLLNLYFPEKATSLASELIGVLVKELKVKPCPIVFSSFSCGLKASMCKFLQIIEGKCQEQDSMDDCRLLRDSVCGYIFDSTPVDFSSDLGTRFAPPMTSWIAHGISSSLDALFQSSIESQRAEYWQTLYSTVSMGAPYLILCSEDDNLAPSGVIYNFAQRLQDLGGEVKLIKWDSSPHVGHYWAHPSEYKAAVRELLVKAAQIYSQRIRQLEGEKMGLEGTNDEISDPFSSLRKAAMFSQQSFQRISLDLNDHFFVPSSVEYNDDRDVGSVRDAQKERYIPIPNLPSINAHGVLGQALFDVCVPKNVEDWEARLSPSSSRPRLAPRRRHSPFNPMKCIRRSRL